jgi:hypothetical protein
MVAHKVYHKLLHAEAICSGHEAANSLGSSVHPLDRLARLCEHLDSLQLLVVQQETFLGRPPLLVEPILPHQRQGYRSLQAVSHGLSN